MKNILLVMALMTAVSLTTPAQSDAGAKIFSPIKEEFSLEVPRSLVSGRHLPGKEDELRLYSEFAEQTYFYVTSGKTGSPEFARFTDMLTATAAGAESAETTIDGLPARKLIFADDEGFYQEILLVEGKSRQYAFHTVSRTKDNAAVSKFFSSLRFDARKVSETDQPATAIIPRESGAAQNGDSRKAESSAGASGNSSVGNGSNSGNGSGVGNGVGNGTGIGSGRGDGVGNVPNPPIAGSQNTAFKILSKPRPSYTDLARFYGISGRVQVRVVFLASGEIGDVETVTKLPFGLTTSAITAARRMTFEPPVKNGAPYAVTKLIEYSFMFY